MVGEVEEALWALREFEAVELPEAAGPLGVEGAFVELGVPGGLCAVEELDVPELPGVVGPLGVEGAFVDLGVPGGL